MLSKQNLPFTDENIHAIVARQAAKYDVSRALDTHPQCKSATDEEKAKWQKQIIGILGGNSRALEDIKAFHVHVVRSIVEDALSTFEDIQTRKPMHLVIAGTPGSGKTTLTSAFANPVANAGNNPEMKAVYDTVKLFNNGNPKIFTNNPFDFPRLFDKLPPETGYIRANHSNTFWLVRPYAAAIMEAAKEVFQETKKQRVIKTDIFEESTLDPQMGSEAFGKMMEIFGNSQKHDMHVVIIGLDVPYKDKVNGNEARAKAGGRQITPEQVEQSHKSFAQNWPELVKISDAAYLIQTQRQISRLTSESIDPEIKRKLDTSLLTDSQVTMKKELNGVISVSDKKKYNDFLAQAEFNTSKSPAVTKMEKY